MRSVVSGDNGSVLTKVSSVGRSRMKASDFLNRAGNKGATMKPVVAKDISFRKDVNNGGLRSRIPSSLIPQHMAVTEKSFLPPEDKDRECWYDEEEKMWVSVIFPRTVPSGRRDVELLEKWLEEKLAECRGGKTTGATSEEGVKDQLNILMIGFREIVRQTAVGCSERGMLLDKIWKGVSSLLDNVVLQMQDTILSCEERMNALNLRASRHETDVLEMKVRHEQEVKNLQQTIGHKWGKRVDVLKRALMESEERAGGVAGFQRSLNVWWPKFELYSDSVLLEMLRGEDYGGGGYDEDDEYMLPDEALVGDVRRIVEMCLVNCNLVQEDRDN